MKTIAITNQKGGTTKTTTAFHLAVGLARDARVLLVDMDPQGNATTWAGLERDNNIVIALQSGGHWSNAVQKTTYDNLCVLPSSKRLQALADEYAPRAMRAQTIGRLRDGLAHLDGFDYCVIDCPPTGSWLTASALTASGYVLASVIASPEAVDGMGDLIETVSAVVHAHNPSLKFIGALACIVSNTTDDRANLRALSDALGDQLLPVHVRKNIDVRKAYRARKSVYDYKPTCNASVDYQHATRLILEKMNG